MFLESEPRTIPVSQAEVDARRTAVDRFVNAPLIRDFFDEAGVISDNDRRYLVNQCLNLLLKRADVETTAQRAGVLNSFRNVRYVHSLLNHTGFTYAYLRSKSAHEEK